MSIPPSCLTHQKIARQKGAKVYQQDDEALEGGTCRAKARRYKTGREGGPPQNGFSIILLG
jgi:hypothetical protein